MRRTGEKSRAGRRESWPAAPRSSGGRAVLGVLTENGQQQQRPGGQVSTAARATAAPCPQSPG